MEMNWISVDENTPDDYDDVIVHAYDGRMIDGIEIATFIKGEGFMSVNFDDQYEKIKSVTHWMPLPTSPVAK